SPPIPGSPGKVGVPAPSLLAPASCSGPLSIQLASCATTTATASCQSTAFEIVQEDGARRLGIRCCGENSMTCDHLVGKMAGKSPVKLAVASGQVAIDGPSLNALADRMVMMPKDRLVLQGHVRLKWGKGDQRAEVTADKVTVGMNEGRLEIQLGSE